MLALAGAMLLPAGQGVAGATAAAFPAAAVPTGVGYAAGEKPVLGCGDRWCGNGWGRRWCGGWRCHGHRHHRHHDHYYEHDFHSGDRHHHDHAEPAPEQPAEPPVKDDHEPIKDDHKEDPHKWDFQNWFPFGDEGGDDRS
ncbi:hypothetical protein FXF51_12055 [Nonomuraea sp. PA05]|uniref:hypothetical protein n=1 Tax=Nonomuraea sp. PA05 TaxID=2604466 RepID=UPI0011D3047C|nr:hypothetical protein [Nonomuraea sp. PA05]TYB68554.1 hypothetical protein FXF51_12055 [Nonomuraea sp. PA05]